MSAVALQPLGRVSLLVTSVISLGSLFTRELVMWKGGAFNGRLVGVNGGSGARGHIRGGAQVLYTEVVERKVVAVPGPP